MPVLGRLFSQTRDNTIKTEIVLLITPRLVRTLARPEVRAAEFAAGTEASTGSPVGVAPFVIPTPQPQPQPQPSAPAKPPSGADQVPFGGVKPPAE
jgi:general secretion pathway protein D